MNVLRIVLIFLLLISTGCSKETGQSVEPAQPTPEITLVINPPPSKNDCPAGFVAVSKNASVGVESAFCAAKYEMKIKGQAVGNQVYNPAFEAESRASGTPWVQINRDEALSECQALGEDFDLMSNAQWQALAREIETLQDDAGNFLNWSNLSRDGANAINRGHTDNSPSGPLAADVNGNPDDEPCIGTGNSSCTEVSHGDYTQKRTHILKSGDIIWDVSGNVWEWMVDTNSDIQAPDGFVSQSVGWDNNSPGFALQSDQLNFGPAGSYASKNTLEFGGLGFAYLNYAAGGIVRGNSFGGGVNAGIYAAGLSLPPEAKNSGRGFRCVFLP